MAILSSEVVITGKDAGVAAMFERIGGKLDALSKAAKISPEFDKLAGSLGKAEAQLRAIDKYNSAKTVSDIGRKKAEEARAKVAEIKSAMEGMEAPTKRMTAALERAQAVEARTVEQYRRRTTATLEASSALGKFGVSAREAGAAETRLKGEINATTAAMERQVAVERKANAQAAAQARQAAAAQQGKRGGHGDGTLAGLAGMYVSHEVGHFAHNVVERYGEFDKERRYGKVVMGLSDDEQEPLIRQAIHGGANSRFNDIQWLESQRELAARGYNRDQVMAFGPVAAQIGQAFDKSMPEGVKALEGAMLGFNKDVTTFDKAMSSATRTADLQVKSSKISGMDYDDIVQLYKYGASPSRMAGLSEENMLAFGAISKKANIGGDEAGTAYRALVKNLLTPTVQARTAMTAAGIDFGRFQKAPTSMNLPGFTSEVARRYGVTLDAKTQAGLGRIFSDQGMLNDASRFTPAVTQYLRSALGGRDAKSLKSIAGLAGSFRDASAGGVDVNGLMNAVMQGISKNPALSNAIFGGKQGGRIFTALGNPDFYAHILDELEHKSQGFGKTVADARMEGFNGAVQKLQSAATVVETAVGRSLDNNGKGGMMTDATNAAAGLLQAFAEATPQIHQLAAAGGAAAAAWGAIKGFDLLSGGFGLKGSATALDAAAAHLMQVGAPGAGGPGGSGGLPGEAAPGGGKKAGLGMRPWMMLAGAVPAIMEAYDYTNMSPEDRKKFDENRFQKGHETATAAGNVVRGFRDKLGLRDILRFSDDNLDEGNEPSIRARGATMNRDRGWRATTVGPPLNDPWLGGERQAIEHRAIQSADAFRRDPEGARGRAMMERNAQTVDITGKIPVDVHSESTVKVLVEAGPGLLAHQTFQSTATRVSTGPSMPNAGAAPHVARRDE